MKKTATYRTAAIWTWVVLILLNLPIVIVVILSFNDGRFLSFPPKGLSLQWYEAYFASDRWRLATFNSFRLGIATVLLATPIGLLASFAIVRGRFPGRRLLEALVIAPMLLPGIIIAIALYFFFAKLGMIGTFWSMLLAHTVITIPIITISINASLAMMDQNLERAAASLGANRWQVFWRVTRPLIQPGILTGAVFAFLISFDELPIAFFMSGTLGETLPARMWSSLRDEIDPTIAVVSTLLIVVSGGLALIGLTVQTRRDAMNDPGKS